MITPLAFKYKCLQQCGFSKIVRPKSETLNPKDMLNICSKCKSTMERKELNIFDNIVAIFYIILINKIIIKN